MSTKPAVKLLAVLVLALSIVGSGSLSGAILASAGEHKLTYADRAADGDPPEVALGIAMGAFRGIFVNFLWYRATELKDKGLFYESIELAKLITRLQPRFPRVWIFHAWNLAYNVSVETQTPQERWQWVSTGLNILRDQAIPANPKQTILYKELGWMYLHKVGGYTDDANRYYKRKHAEEWHVVLGAPPRVTAETSSRDQVVALYVEDYMRPLVDAAQTRSSLRQRNPQADELLTTIEQRTGLPPSFDLLERYTVVTEARESVRRQVIEQRYTPQDQAIDALLDEPSFAGAWEDAILFTRRRVVEEDYRMIPLRMLRLTEQLGPIDWRSAAGHAIYWSAEGVRQGLDRATNETQELFDFVNTDRITLQGIQQSFRYGTIFFNYLGSTDYGVGDRDPYVAFPNFYFAEAYDTIRDGVLERGGVYQSLRRPKNDYATGYENFMREVIIHFFRRGDLEEAERWLAKFRNLGIQNQNELTREMEGGLTLEEFVIFNSLERVTSPHIANSTVAGSLFGAFQSLLNGNTKAYETQVEFAADAHRYFLNAQLRDTVTTAGGAEARMEFLDRDFGFVIGTALFSFMDQLAIDDAEALYTRITDLELQRYVFDRIKARFEPILDEVEAQGGAGFEIVFPEPPGMEQFRTKIQAKLRQRLDAERGINRQ
ncbi:MAG: hypothetical protein AAGI17_02800 [Planctomycetota bacterium]